MDALTLAEAAASLAVTAGKVTLSLQDVINTTGSRGKPGGPGPLSSLTGEVSVLSGLLQRVDKILRECHVQALSLAHIDEVLWDPIGNTMMDCKATLEALDNLIAAIRGTSLARSIIFRRLGVQARVDAQARELAAFVGKIYQSSCAMRTIEAVINICLSFRGSMDVSQETLFRNLESLKVLLQHDRAVVSDSSSFKSDPFAAQLSRNLQALTKAAERLHSSARTTSSICYSQSAGAGSSCSETSHLTDFQRERIGTWNRLQPVREEGYMNGSALAAQSRVGSDASTANKGHPSPNPKRPTAKSTRPDSRSSYTARPSAPLQYIELDTGKEPASERHWGEQESDKYLAIADSQVGVSDTGKELVHTRLPVGEYDTEKELAPHHQLGGYDTEKELVPIGRQIGECDTDKELVPHHRWGEYYDTEKELVPTERQIGEADTDKEFVAEILPQSASLLPHVVGLTSFFPDRKKPLGPQAYRSLNLDRSLTAPGVARAIKKPEANLVSGKKAVSKALATPDDNIRTLGLSLTLDGPYIAGLTSKGVLAFTAWLEYPSQKFEGYWWRSSWKLSIRSQGRPPTAPVKTLPNSWMSYRRSMLALMEPECKDTSESIERLRFCVADIEKFVQKQMKQARDAGYLGSAPLDTGFVALPGKILIAQGEMPKLRSIFTETILWKDATLVPQCSAILSAFLRGCMRSVPAAKPKPVVVLHCGVVSTETQRFRVQEADKDQYKLTPIGSPISNSFGSICVERAFVDLVRRKLNQLMISSNTKLETALCEKLMRSFCRQFRKSILYEFDNDNRDWLLAIDLPTGSLTFNSRELNFSNAEILACFEPIVRGIRNVMRSIISRSQEPVTHVCLAGSLAASSFLYSQLQDMAASLRLGIFVVRDSNGAFTAASAAYDRC